MELRSDKELWLQAKQDDAMAFEVLYNRYWEKFYSIAYWHLMNQNDAKDLVQELFIDLWHKRSKIIIADTVEGYLRNAARNRILNHIRMLNNQKKAYEIAFEKLPASQASMEEENEHKEFVKLYRKEIEKLPKKMRDIYLMIKENGFAVADVAVANSVSEQTIKNQLSMAAKKIRDALEQYKVVSLVIGFNLSFAISNNMIMITT